MPLLILEGADGSGKSTLAAKLLKGTGHPTLLVKRSGPPGSMETLEFQAKWLKEQAESGLNIIADRHPLISECIYRPIVRKEGLPPWSVFDVADILRDKRILLVYCRAERQAMFDNSKVEEQMEGVHEHYGKLVHEYDRWMTLLEEHGVSIYWYNYQVDTDEEVINEVRGFWEGNR